MPPTPSSPATSTRLGVRFMRLAHHYFAGRTFSLALGSTLARFIDEPDAGRPLDAPLTFAYTIPRRLCRPSPGATAAAAAAGDSATGAEDRGVLTIGPVMAAFDELSSLAFMVRDANRRGGVSVQLAASIHYDPTAPLDPVGAGAGAGAGGGARTGAGCTPRGGDVVLVSTRVRKLGGSLGFADMAMHRAVPLPLQGGDGDPAAARDTAYAPGELLASGSHIKFLAVGRAWNLLINDSTLPHLLPLLERWGEAAVSPDTLLGRLLLLVSKNRDGGRGARDALSDCADTVVPASSSGGMGPSTRVLHSGLSAAGDSGGSVGWLHANLNLQQQQDPGQEASAFLFPVRALFKNGLGFMHGGVAAINAEETALLAAQDGGSGEGGGGGRFVRQLSMRYLSPMHGNVHFVCRPDVSEAQAQGSSHRPGSSTHGEVRRLIPGQEQGQGRVDCSSPRNLCAQFECLWG